MKRFALVAVFAIACGAVPAQAQTLALGYHAGDAYKYTFHSTTKQTIVAAGVTLPADVDMSANEAVKVVSVDAAGAADLALTLSSFAIKSTTGGVSNTMTGVPDTTMDMKVAADGRILSLDGNQIAAGNPFLAFSGMGGGFFVTAVLPSNAVKPGDTWSKDYDQANPGGAGSVHLTTHSTYLRNETLNGTNSAVVETTSTGAIDITLGTADAAATTAAFGGSIKGTITSDVTTWIDPIGHRVLKTHSTATNDGTLALSGPSMTAIPGMSGPITIKGTGTTDITSA
jgi:hypothetical protein